MDSITRRPEGLYISPLATNGGRRAGVRDRIREVQKNCPNQFVVKTNVLVTKILLEKLSSSVANQFKAIGVEYREGAHLNRVAPKTGPTTSTLKEFRATREVILSAGAFNTPQLL